MHQLQDLPAKQCANVPFRGALSVTFERTAHEPFRHINKIQAPWCGCRHAVCMPYGHLALGLPICNNNNNNNNNNNKQNSLKGPLELAAS